MIYKDKKNTFYTADSFLKAIRESPDLQDFTLSDSCVDELIQIAMEDFEVLQFLRDIEMVFILLSDGNSYKVAEVLEPFDND